MTETFRVLIFHDKQLKLNCSQPANIDNKKQIDRNYVDNNSGYLFSWEDDGDFHGVQCCDNFKKKSLNEL